MAAAAVARGQTSGVLLIQRAGPGVLLIRGGKPGA